MSYFLANCNLASFKMIRSGTQGSSNLWSCYRLGRTKEKIIWYFSTGTKDLTLAFTNEETSVAYFSIG